MRTASCLVFLCVAFLVVPMFTQEQVVPQAVSESQDEQCSQLTIGLDDSCEDPLLASVFHGRSDGSLFEPKKMWCAKRLNFGMYKAGRPSNRQIKYVADSGFKSVLSVFDLGAITEKERKFVEEVTGMKFFTLLEQGEIWHTVSAVEKMTRILPQLELPTLLHCEHGVSITFLTLMYYANQTALDPTFEPRVDSKRFYEISNALGIDFVTTWKDTKDVVEAITGESVPSHITGPNVTDPNYVVYWPAFPVHYNWYTAGQIRDDDFETITSVGFNHIVNIRKGVVHNGKPSQETVQLLNVKATTATYGEPPRQSDASLQKNVIFPSRENSYIDETSSVNFERSNPHEFGDHIGYNETLERAAVAKAGIDYTHMPLAGCVGPSGFIYFVPGCIPTRTYCKRVGQQACGL